jgi:DNA repair exonuclease SbcCD ATPase subunit
MKNTPNIIFKRLYIKNFLCFDEVEFDFSKHHGLNLITGKNNDIPNVRNGSGKSSFLSAFYFSLYGKAIKALSVESLVNKCAPEDDVIVEISLQSNDKEYIILSKIEKGKYNSCQLFENGKNITKSGIKETRKYIETEILKIPANTFLRTVILTKENSKDFFNIPKHEKKKFIEELFDLLVFGKMFETIHRDSLNLQSEIKTNEKELKILEKNITELNKSQKDFYESRDVRVKALSDTIKNELIEISNLVNAKDNSEINSKVQELKSNLDKLKNLKESLLNKINQLKININTSNKEISEKTKYLKKYEKILSLLCDSCKSIISDEFSISNTKNEIEQIRNPMISLESNLEKLKSQYEITIEKLKETLKKNEKLSELKYKIQKHKEDLQTLRKNESPFLSIIESNEKGKGDVLKTLESQYSQVQYLELLEMITSDNGVKKFIISDVIDVLNSRIKYYLSKLGANYICNFNNNFDFTFMTNRGEREYNSFSSGEISRINISTIFAFRDLLANQTLSSTNVLFIDEYFDSTLDDYSINALLKILKREYEENGYTPFIISHRKEILDEGYQGNTFDNTIMFEKTSEISKIVKDKQAGIL